MRQTFQAHAPDIGCGGCANEIKHSLGSVSGVKTVEVDIPEKNVTVQYYDTQVSDCDLRALLDKAGYPKQ